MSKRLRWEDEDVKSQLLGKNMKLLEHRRLGLFLDFLKLADYFPKLSLPDSRQNSTITPFSGSFREAKAVKTEIEAKKAETICHVRRMMAAPR